MAKIKQISYEIYGYGKTPMGEKGEDKPRPYMFIIAVGLRIIF